MLAMPPLRFPVYCSPAEALALSEISSESDFLAVLDTMLLEGLPSTAIPNIRGGTREHIRPEAFIDHRVTLAGEVFTRKSLPVFFVSYEGKPSSCYRVEEPRLVWTDLRFLTKDFLDRLGEKTSATKRRTAVDVAKEIIAASGLSEQELRDPNVMKWLRASRAYRACKDRPSDDAFRRALDRKE